MEIRKKFHLKATSEREKNIIDNIKNLKELGCSIKINENTKEILVVCPSDVRKEAFRTLEAAEETTL